MKFVTKNRHCFPYETNFSRFTRMQQVKEFTKHHEAFSNKTKMPATTKNVSKKVSFFSFLLAHLSLKRLNKTKTAHLPQIIQRVLTTRSPNSRITLAFQIKKIYRKCESIEQKSNISSKSGKKIEKLSFRPQFWEINPKRLCRRMSEASAKNMESVWEDNTKKTTISKLFKFLFS